MINSVEYYDLHAKQYISDTMAVDMREIYQPFLARLPFNSAILDAGCGSGRDAVAFEKLGYQVTAFDACDLLAAHAGRMLGRSVAVKRFEQVGEIARYHGIWACASLLHVSSKELPAIFEKLWRALKPGGVLYCSFKWGHGERLQEGRLFTDADAVRIEHWTSDLKGCSDRQSWITKDQRPGRSEQWLNVLLFKADA
ncbi:MAG: class I SAM-dependent methyltransferase [Pseudomonadaceae bacterium]